MWFTKQRLPLSIKVEYTHPWYPAALLVTARCAYRVHTVKPSHFVYTPKNWKQFKCSSEAKFAKCAAVKHSSLFQGKWFKLRFWEQQHSNLSLLQCWSKKLDTEGPMVPEPIIWGDQHICIFHIVIPEQNKILALTDSVCILHIRVIYLLQINTRKYSPQKST